MAKRNNCPNCGSPIDPGRVHCAYCGTYYFDLAAFDCSKKCFVKFKTHLNGHECYVTALARPSLEETEVSCDTSEYIDPLGHILIRYPVNKTCTLKANFDCQINPENNTLFTIEVEDDAY